MPFVATWEDLDNIILSEVNQRKADIIYMTYMWNLKKGTNKLICRTKKKKKKNYKTEWWQQKRKEKFDKYCIKMNRTHYPIAGGCSERKKSQESLLREVRKNEVRLCQ